jgi:DNA-binding MarR family transcriptional regulator
MPRTSTRKTTATGRQAQSYNLEEQVGFLLRRAYQRASANLVDQIGPYDLTPPQFATLAKLYERGNLSQNLLGRLVAMEPANIRDVVLRLKRRRLVATERDPADARLVLVSLTPSGFSLTQKLLPVEMDATSKTLAPLNPSEREVLYDLLRRLAET